MKENCVEFVTQLLLFTSIHPDVYFFGITFEIGIVQVLSYGKRNKRYPLPIHTGKDIPATQRHHV